MSAKRKDKTPTESSQSPLFPDLPPPPPTDQLVRLRAIRRPVWTEQKAKLIARYLKLFTYVTKHGTYIDGFAGQQSEHAQAGWAADLVLGTRPWRLRRLYLCDAGSDQVEKLNALVAAQPPKRTFECRWATVKALAGYRHTGNKIELFYFLPISWLNRAFIATRRAEALADIEAWWGGPDWRDLIDMQHHEKALAFRKRFFELGYKHVLPFPIVDSQSGDRIMFYMILATDHPDAPALMWRAYDQAVPDQPGWDQLELLKK